MRIITIATQKGGTGKTTTAQALAQGLRIRGKKTLLIDMDGQQAGLTLICGGHPSEANIYQVLRGKCAIEDAIQKTNAGDLIPSGYDAETLEADLKAGRELRLKKAMSGLEGYDFVIIDTPPASGVLVDNALTVSDGVIIPAQADVMGPLSLEHFVKTVSEIREYTNPDLRILGILITRYNMRTTLSKVMLETLEARAETLGTIVYKTKIRECVAIQEDQATQSNIFDRPSKYNSVKDYGAFVSEVLEQFGERYNGKS